MAKVDGAGNVTNDIKSIQSSIADTARTAKSVSAEVAGMGGAFSKLSGVGASVNSAMQAAAGGITAATSGIRAMSGAIGGLMSMFDPWIQAINLAISAFHFLYDVLSEDVEPAEKEQHKTVQDLAAVYLSLGENASWAAAQQKLAAESAQKASKDNANNLYAEIEAQKKLVAQLTGPASRLAADAKGAEIAEKRGEISKSEVVQIMNARDAAQKRLQVAKDHLKTLEAKIPAYEAELKEIQAIAQAEQKAAQAKKEAEQKAAEEQRAAEQAAKDAETRRKIAAQKAIAQKQAELATIATLQKQADDAIWAAEGHSEEENFERQVELQKQAAEERIKDAYRLAQALDLIDQKAAAEKQKRDAETAKKAAEENEKWLAQAAERAKQAAPGDQDSELQRLMDQSAKVDAQLKALWEDEARFSSMSVEDMDKYSEQYLQTLNAISQADEAHLALQNQIADRQAKLREKEKFDAVKNSIAISKANRAAIDAQVKGYQELAEGLDTLGKGSTLMQAAQMTASGLQAAADAIDYTAEAAANFAIGNVGTGLGLAAAAAGKTAAAVKYAKSLVELGFSAFDTGGGGGQTAAAATPSSTASLTGQSAESKTTEINVTMGFSGQAGRLGRYLVEEINAEARTPGGARVNAGVIR